jgi:2-succinyl-5-enolpyruvyl-6-hydroxy-3-cyclohexene-1-carboxylate synthase
MSLPETSAGAVRYARTVACRAVAIASSQASAGPVHINFPFREPLVPTRTRPGDLPDPSAGDTDVARDRGTADFVEEDRAPYLAIRRAQRRPAGDEVTALAVQLRGIRRGLIVCGPQDDSKLPPVAATLAKELRFPILADPLSLVRCGPHTGPLVIDAYDAFLRDDETAEALRSELILRFGAIPTSKPLLGYLQRHGRQQPEQPDRCRQLLVDVDLTERAHRWPDPTLTATDAFESDPRSFCEALIEALRSSSGSEARTGNSEARSAWAESWIAIAQRTRIALTSHLEAEPGLSEPGVFAELAHILPGGATLFAGNGMPVRDLDTFFAARALPTRFLANRGASGIDGVVSAALGASAAVDGPLVLVVGDLSFYHDMNGLLAARRHSLSATIVLLNNNGGGIFSFLPQADDPEHFEELFGAPHGLDFRYAAEMYGLAYRRVRSRDEFRTAMGEALGGPGVTLVEVRTERGRNAELHRSLWKAVARSLGEDTPHGSTR